MKLHKLITAVMQVFSKYKYNVCVHNKLIVSNY